MQLCLERNNLLKALSKVQSIVEKKHTIPILANVKFECTPDSVILTATDMDIAVKEIVPPVGTPSLESITMPVHTLHEIVRKLPDGSQIEFEVSDKKKDQIAIKVGLSKFVLPSLPAEEFPNFENNEPLSEFEIDSSILYTLLNQTKHAVSFEETRYYLTGTYLHASDKDGETVLRAVTTDTHRLAKAEADLPEGAKSMPGIILPRKAMLELIRLLDNHNGLVKVSISSNKATFIIGSTTITSKLVDGKFPDYSVVIPSNNNMHLEVATKELSNSIDLVISVSADKTKTVRLNIEPTRLIISASSETNGNASGSEVIEAKYDGTPIKIGFNARYILDALSTIEGKNIRFSIGEEGGAVIIQDADENSCIHILMPMQG